MPKPQLHQSESEWNYLIEEQIYLSITPTLETIAEFLLRLKKYRDLRECFKGESLNWITSSCIQQIIDGEEGKIE